MKALRIAVATFVLSVCLSVAADSATKNVTIDEFDKLRANTNNIILDVRTPKEFNAGHIPGAKLVDINSSDFDANIAKLDKSKTYLVHCAAGVRSAKACKKLETLGFTNIVHLPAGFQGWKKADKAIEK
jgi:phage shock protein E